MCDPLTIAALAATAAGTATKAYATHQELKKQDSIAAEGIMKQGELNKQGINDVAATTGQLAKSNAATQDKSNQQLAAYRSALQQGLPGAAKASPDVPGASKAFKAAQAAAGSSAQDYLGGIAQDAATTQGTALERVDENQKLADTSGKLGLLQGQSNEQAYVTKLKAQSVTANPWLMGLGTLLQGAGAGMGMSAGAAAAGGGATAVDGGTIAPSLAGIDVAAPTSGWLTASQLGNGGSAFGKGLLTAFGSQVGKN